MRRGFVFLNDRGRVEYWSARTRELIAHYVGRSPDDALPAALAGHLRRLREKVDGLRPAELPGFRRGASELRIRFVRHPRRQCYVLIVEEIVGLPAPEETLTPREREVFEWLGQGKANSEIATILGLSVHTVKRHLERVFAKLGVESRCAAAVLAASHATPPPAAPVGLSTYITRTPPRV
jgi:DNA-binding CsgD family transcriptional regulator